MIDFEAHPSGQSFPPLTVHICLESAACSLEPGAGSLESEFLKATLESENTEPLCNLCS